MPEPITNYKVPTIFPGMRYAVTKTHFFSASTSCPLFSRLLKDNRDYQQTMACGMPALATAVGSIVEQINHADTGFLLERDDCQTMAQYVLKLMNELALCHRLGEAASTKARSSFGLKQQGDQYLKYFDA